MVLLFAFGVLLGLLFGPLRMSFANNTALNFNSQIASSQLAFALIMLASSLKLFSNDELVRYREESAGIPSGPLFLGKLCGSFMDYATYPIAFAMGKRVFVVI